MRGSTYDLYFPTVGLHSSVRPQGRGPVLRARCHFRAIVGGLAVGRRLDWFTERAAWDPYQEYQGATNLLTTKLSWRHGPINVLSHRFCRDGRLPAFERRPGEIGQASTSSDFSSRTRGKRIGGRILRSTCRRRSTAESATWGLSWHDHRQVAPGNQPWPRPLQPQARPRCDRRVCPGSGRPRGSRV